MSNPAYLWLTDENNSPIVGSSLVSGRVGAIELKSFTHNISIPADNQTGRLTGTRVRKCQGSWHPWLFKTASRSLLPVTLPRVVILTPIDHVRKRIVQRTVKNNFGASDKITAEVVSYH